MAQVYNKLILDVKKTNHDIITGYKMIPMQDFWILSS